MVGRRHLTVGLITQQPPNTLHLPIFEYFTVGAVEEATRREQTVKVLAPVTDDAGSYDVYAVLRDAHVDGIIVHNVGWLADALSDWHMPVVYAGVGGEHGDLPVDRIGVVTTDERGGMRQSARHLGAHGHAQVGVIGNATHPGGPPLGRLRAFMDQLGAGAGTSHYVDPGFWTWSPEDGYRATTQLLAEHPDVTAIQTGSDWMAIGAMRALTESGRRIPEDVEVAGFGDFPVSEFLNPPLTTVTWPLRDLGAKAVEMLLAQLDDDASGFGTVVLPTGLVVRQSTGGRRSGRKA